MDPNANLSEQRLLANRLLNNITLDKYDIDRLADLILALDEWISRGGFLPDRWEIGQKKNNRET